MNSLWLRYVRFMEIQEKVLQRLLPRRTRRVPYAWPLAPDVCSCDVDFCDYLRERAVRGKAIFHFGTGAHHEVGLRNAADGSNDILAITASPSEQRRYLRLVARQPRLADRYQVLLADIYALEARTLPQFDFVTLFHLCEFTPPPGRAHLLDDRGLLEMLVGRLKKGGRVLFYAHSNGRKRTELLLRDAVASGRLALEEEFRSLRIYREPRA